MSLRVNMVMDDDRRVIDTRGDISYIKSVFWWWPLSFWWWPDSGAPRRMWCCTIVPAPRYKEATGINWWCASLPRALLLQRMPSLPPAQFTFLFWQESLFQFGLANVFHGGWNHLFIDSYETNTYVIRSICNTCCISRVLLLWVHLLCHLES